MFMLESSPLVSLSMLSTAALTLLTSWLMPFITSHACLLISLTIFAVSAFMCSFLLDFSTSAQDDSRRQSKSVCRSSYLSDVRQTRLQGVKQASRQLAQKKPKQ